MNIKMFGYLKNILLSLSLILIITSCTRTKLDTTLRTTLPNSSGQFNPLYIFNVFDRATTDLIYENLLTRDKNDKLINNLAKSITSLEGNKRYQIVVAKNHFFSDGQMVKANDVLHSFSLLAHSNYIGPYQKYVKNIVGFESFKNGKSSILAGLKLVNEFTLEVEFTNNSLKNYQLFTFPILQASSFTFEQLKNGLEQPLPRGSNFYQLDRYKASQYIILKRNFYMNKFNNSNIEKIEILLKGSPQDMLMLLNGKIDLISGISEESKIAELETKKILDKKNYLRSGYTSMVFNTEAEPTNNILVRKALRYAFDRKLFLNSYLGNLAVELIAPTNIVWPFYKEMVGKLEPFNYNLSKAKTLLDEAGYALNNDGYRYDKQGNALELVWLVSKNSKAIDYLEPVLQHSYKELGIKLFIKTVDQVAFYHALYQEQTGYNMVIESLFEEWEPYGSTDRYLASNSGQGGQNISRLHDATNEALLAKLDASSTRDEYLDNYKEWLLYFNDLSVVMVLYGNQFADIYNKRLKNLSTNSLYTWRMQVDKMQLD